MLSDLSVAMATVALFKAGGRVKSIIMRASLWAYFVDTWYGTVGL